MQALQILDIKQGASHLFTQSSFDYFLVKEASVTTFSTITIDGHLYTDYFSDDELETLKDTQYSSWQMIRPIFYSLIKGKKLPRDFSLIFSLSKDNIQNFLKQYQLEQFEDALEGLYLNFKYKDQKLQVISGVSLNVFTMDKTVERAWDDMTKKILKHHKIAFE
ncbi:hypothetical protein P261_02309 [Lachnospiraceae bacterium TWA4]|nr:hypothetical protein P261_02309 [Lachnospiraceae bacterium TWA4]